jgi:hypothetical protein
MSGEQEASLGETAGWWCVSLTSPSGPLDRMILATPIQAAVQCCFINGAVRVSIALQIASLSAPPAPPFPALPHLHPIGFFFPLPLFCFGSRLSLRMHSPILVCRGMLFYPVFWKGREAWQRFTWRWWRCEVCSFLCKNTDYAEIYRGGLLWTRLVLWRMLWR